MVALLNKRRALGDGLHRIPESTDQEACFEFCVIKSSLGGMKANAHIYSPKQINISRSKFLVEQLNLKTEKLEGYKTGKALPCRNHKSSSGLRIHPALFSTECIHKNRRQKSAHCYSLALNSLSRLLSSRL